MLIDDKRQRTVYLLAPMTFGSRLGLILSLVTSALLTHPAQPNVQAADLPVKPLRALLILGGCCHDYAKQKDILKEGIEKRAHAQVEIVYNPDKTTRARFDIYEKQDWAKGYDVVIHDECSADIRDLPYVQNILAAHQGGVPAVNLHCAMHSYRTGTDDWFKFIGLQSSSHGPQLPIAIRFVDKEHPITQTLADWTTIDEELYNNIKLFETAHPLARGKQAVKQRDGTTREVDYVVAWVNDYNKTRIFNTTIGHNNATVADDRYLDLVSRGLLWACDKLNDTYLKPVAKKQAAADLPVSLTASEPTPAQSARPQTSPAAAKENDTDLLKEVKVPAEFEATIFARPPMVNYPVFAAAAPDGTLYVSSDGNASLDRKPNRGRVLRLRDADNDGHADEMKEFVKDVDSPRGLVWDHDRLYLMHPPHISVYVDKDGDGVADEQKLLVKNIAFTFKDRPADHSSNGLELGIDGWIYCAIGDFGFMEAEGADGRKLQLRAGGVVRVRPDGTGLELFARGTRNILEAAVSPLLDLFARDNTNDGGGWDIRLHHFTGLTEHGYPTLFKNFASEIIQPLAIYGGGSGCGGAWIDEPGIPTKWNNAPFTADWGRNWVYHHRLTPTGATFAADQTEFAGATRVTDLDVDALSRIYVASWKGASYTWAGPNVGYLFRLTPKGCQPDPLPNFQAATDGELVKLLESRSHRRRLEAQRTLLRRNLGSETQTSLAALAADRSKPLASRVAALFTLKQGLGEQSVGALTTLASDPTIAAWAIRALTDHEGQLANVPAAPLLASLKSSDARTRKEAAVSLARLGASEHSVALPDLLTDNDPIVAHTAVEALRRLKGVAACFSIIDRKGLAPQQRAGALRVLQSLHETDVVDGLITRLNQEKDPIRRLGLISALCRLHFIEGQWKGNSWGTRPDTRGPYYQPEAWSETKRIGEVLDEAVAKSDRGELQFLALELARHRIPTGAAFAKLEELARQDLSLLSPVVGQLARSETIPAEAVPLLTKAASSAETRDLTRAQAVQALAKTDVNADSVRTMLAALGRLKQSKTGGPEFEQARDAFFGSPRIEREHRTLAKEAAKLHGEPSLLADAALLRIYERRGSSDVRSAVTTALENGWSEPKRRAQIISATAVANRRIWTDKILAALNDPDKTVAQAAKEAAAALKLELPKAEASSDPLIGEMKSDDVFAAVLNAKGDIERGQALFTQQGCANCHTVKPQEPLRGPYLAQVAAIFKRRELAEAILLPNKSIAQGFAANRFVLKDGAEAEGFVVSEAADKITIRTVAAQEIVIRPQEVTERTKLEKSLMPDGTVANLSVPDFAALLDYLESVGKKQ